MSELNQLLQELEADMSELDRLRQELDADKTAGPANSKHSKIVSMFVDAVMSKNTLGGLQEVEIKDLQIHHYAGEKRTYVWLIVGMTGDEGTYASIFARDTRSVIIGKNGGFELLNGKRQSYRYGRFNAIYEPTY